MDNKQKMFGDYYFNMMNPNDKRKVYEAYTGYEGTTNSPLRFQSLASNILQSNRNIDPSVVQRIMEYIQQGGY